MARTHRRRVNIPDFCCGLFAFAAALVLGLPGGEAQAAPRFKLDALLTFQHITEDNADLATRSESPTESYSAQGRLRPGFRVTDDIYAFADFRAVKTYGDLVAEDDTGAFTVDDSYLELRQAWVRAGDLFGRPFLNLQVGRQRIREPRTIWWNRDIEAVRVNFKTTLHTGFVGIGQTLASYRTSDSEFNADDQDRLRVFAESEYQWKLGHFAGLRALYERDYSGTEQAGTQVPFNDLDLEDANLLWAGARSSGSFGAFRGLKDLRYRVDAIVVAGTEKLVSTGAAANAAFRTVTGVVERDVLGWAVDAGVEIALEAAKFKPTFNFGYAFGSGDGDPSDGTDNAFRQTGLHGNASRRPGAIKAVRNYGEVLRPELSNLHILNAGVNVPMLQASDLNVNYYYYHLDEDAASLRRSGVSAALNGSDKSLGQAADVLLNVDVSKELGLKQEHLQEIMLSIALGSFFAGDAYGPASGEVSYRTFAELQMKF